MTRHFLIALLLMALLGACTMGKDDPQIVYVTATPQLGQSGALEVPTLASPPTLMPRVDLSPVPEQLLVVPTPNTGRTLANRERPQSHVVQAGDTLSGIALGYGTTLAALLELNELVNPDALFVGQVINLPELPSETTPDFKIIADGRLVRGPGSSAFDVGAFVAAQPGFIRMVTDLVETRRADGSASLDLLTAADVVERVALEFSVDPRLLLALLEYRAGWLSNPNPPDDLKAFPLISEANSEAVNRKGLYRQLAWAANQLNYGYYGWKYRDLQALSFTDQNRRLIATGLNPGTVGLQYFLSLFQSLPAWQRDVSKDGFFSTYWAYFGDPFSGVLDPLVPPGLQQPEFGLPFASGEIWYFTGGWHGGWGGGSAWAAVDFAPPDDPSQTGGVLCYVSSYSVRALAPGVIARSGDGVVILDLDGDMDESTGWTILYLHIASEGRVAQGTRVNTGDSIGRASCEGGFSTATHLHLGRRFNGEWIPADCQYCPADTRQPAFVMNGWSVSGLLNQEYQGFLLKANGDRRVAEQGRSNPANQVGW